MSKKRITVFLLSILFITLLFTKPYNYFCRSSSFCKPIIFSYYFPQKEGKFLYDIIFEAKNSSQDLEISSQVRSVVLKSGKNYEVEYKVRNKTDKDLTFRPMRYVKPFDAVKHLKFYECLCFQEYKIKAKSERILSVKFKLKTDIDDDEIFKKFKIIRLGYEISDEEMDM